MHAVLEVVFLSEQGFLLWIGKDTNMQKKFVLYAESGFGLMDLTPWFAQKNAEKNGLLTEAMMDTI